MENEKKVYEEPTVAMVEFDFSERIAASGCNYMFGAGPNACSSLDY